jgi:hypothetical protein
MLENMIILAIGPEADVRIEALSNTKGRTYKGTLAGILRDAWGLTQDPEITSVSLDVYRVLVPKSVKLAALSDKRRPTNIGWALFLAQNLNTGMECSSLAQGFKAFAIVDTLPEDMRQYLLTLQLNLLSGSVEI